MSEEESSTTHTNTLRKNKPPSTARIACSVLLAVVEVALFSGISYGVSAITQVLDQRKVYAHLCDTTPRNGTVVECNALQQQVTLAFTIGQVLNPLGSLASGFLLDKAGYRAVKAVAAAVFAAGCMCLTFTQPGTDWLIFPALVLTGISGVQILIAELKLAPMVRWFPFVIASLISGFFDASTSVFSTLTLLISAGLDSTLVFSIYTAAGVVCILGTIPLYPGDYNSIEEQQQEQAELDLQLQQQPKSKEAAAAAVVEQQQPTSIWKVVLTLEFVLTTIWTVCNQLRLNYFIGSHNSYVATIDSNEEVINSYATTFNYFFLLGPVMALIPGVITDWQKKCIPMLREITPRTMRLNLVATLAITPIVGIISCLLMLIKSTSVLIPIYIIIAANRVFLYGTFGNFLIAAFPGYLFGQLYTAILLISSVFQFLTVPLTEWLIASDGPAQVNSLLISLLVLSLAHPIVLLLRNRKPASVDGLVD